MPARDRLLSVLDAEIDTLYAWFDGKIDLEDVADRLIAAGVTMPEPPDDSDDWPIGQVTA